jgi:hypothetical protein
MLSWLAAKIIIFKNFLSVLYICWSVKPYACGMLTEENNAVRSVPQKRIYAQYEVHLFLSPLSFPTFKKMKYA